MNTLVVMFQLTETEKKLQQLTVTRTENIGTETVNTRYKELEQKMKPPFKNRLEWIEQGLTSPPTQYRLSGRQFYGF